MIYLMNLKIQTIPSFIPRSSRVKLDLSYSKALANDTAIDGLKRDLELCKKEFTEKVTKIFKSCAELEMNHCKQDRIRTFLSYTLNTIRALIVFERIDTPLVAPLNSLLFSIRTIIEFLHKIKTNILLIGEQNFFRDYLKMDEPQVRENLVKNFIPLEQHPFNDIERLDNELEFQDIISDKLINLILPVTIKLQSITDKENKIKKAAALLAAEFKKDKIITATVATAISIENTTTANVNMELHIKKLVEEAVKKHTSSNQKNSPGSKKPQPSLPKTNKGKRNKNQNQRTNENTNNN